MKTEVKKTDLSKGARKKQLAVIRRIVKNCYTKQYMGVIRYCERYYITDVIRLVRLLEDVPEIAHIERPSYFNLDLILTRAAKNKNKLQLPAEAELQDVIKSADNRFNFVRNPYLLDGKVWCNPRKSK